MGRVTQRVDPSVLDDLVARPPRAAIAFTHGDRVEAVPVVFLREDGRIWIGVERSVPTGNESGVPVVVLVDDGRYWFELRALTWRGHLVPAPASPPELPADLRWFEFRVDSSVSWEFATLHEEP